jgi:hypothetical protein
MVDHQDKQACDRCGHETCPIHLKPYRPMKIRVCKTCYLELERRERYAREECFRAVKEL